VYYSAIKIFNNLPYEIKDFANDILPFRNALMWFLLANSFYNSKEYFNYRTMAWSYRKNARNRNSEKDVVRKAVCNNTKRKTKNGMAG